VSGGRRRAIPIIHLYGTLIVSIQVEITDALVVALKEDLAQELRARDVDGVIIEVSGADIIDSYIARCIRDIGVMSRLMGARTVLVGLDPAMASTLVDMGMLLGEVQTALNLETALSGFMRFAGGERADVVAIDEVLSWRKRDDSADL
jgi:rsbT antagonist protein RsbS